MAFLRRSSARRLKNHTRKVTSDTANRIRLATALISGLTPRRTAENTSIGKVVEPGPETKLASTRSSRDSAKDIIPPAANDGAIIGMVIRKNTFHGRAPKSIAASSIDRSSSRKRADTTTATYAAQKVVCAIQMVTMPRSMGQPIICAMATNSSNSDRPVITSGITRGAVTRPPHRVRPLKRVTRVSTKAAMVPNATAVTAVSHAITEERATETINWVLSNSPRYHLSDQPPQTVTSLEALNE